MSRTMTPPQPTATLSEARALNPPAADPPRKRMYLEKRSTFMEVDPALAAAWIERTQARNRKPDARWVKHLAGMMPGRWDANGEPIILDWFGDVRDGLQRLLAVIESGATILTNVVTGVDPATFRTMNNNRARHKGDYLHVAGEGHARKLAALLRLIHLWETDRLHQGRAGGRDTALDPDAMLDLLARHPGCRGSILPGANFYSQFRGLPASQWMFAHYAFGRVDPDLRDQFCAALATGEGLAAGSPAAVLRNQLVNNMQSRARPDAADVLAVTIKAWRAFATGETVRRLAWRRGGSAPEPFPAVDPFRANDFPLRPETEPLPQGGGAA